MKYLRKSKVQFLNTEQASREKRIPSIFQLSDIIIRCTSHWDTPWQMKLVVDFITIINFVYRDNFFIKTISDPQIIHQESNQNGDVI